MDFRKIVAIALLVLMLVFVFMNLEEARIWFFGVRAEMPIALVVIASGALGFGSCWLFTFVKSKKPPKAPAKST